MDWLPEDVDRRKVQDVKLVLEKMFEAWSKTEVKAGRTGNMPVPASSSVVVTHVDRLFGWLRQTRARCETEGCGLLSEWCTFPTSRIVTLPLKSGVERNCSVTDLYVEYCLPEVEYQHCHNCSVSTKHAVSSRLATTPEMLVLCLERSSDSPTISVDVEEELQLPGLAWMRLVAVIYRGRRHDNTTFYSCSCRGPMDAWWYFEDGQAPEPIKRSISHVKQKQACMLFYERIVRKGKAVKRKRSGTLGGPGQRDKRPRTSVSISLARTPAVTSPPGVWPVERRSLKRYPSWVDSLELEVLRQARFERAALRHVQDFYSSVVSASGGKPLRLTMPEKVKEIGLDLGDAVVEKFDEEIITHEDLVFVLACVVNAIDQTRRSSDDHQLVAVVAHAYRKLLDDAIDKAKHSSDPYTSLEMLSRVTGIVDFEVEILPEVTSPVTEQPMASVPVTVQYAQDSETVDMLVLNADLQGMDREGAVTVEEPALETRDASASSAPASMDPKPRRRMKRVLLDDAEAVPVRRSARIASRSSHADAGASGVRRCS